MNPGKELDRLIAEKVMGLDVSKYPITREEVDVDSRSILTWTEDIPAYSTDFSAAWQVVLHFEDKLDSVVTLGTGDKARWQFFVWTDKPSEASTAPLAICIGALRAIGMDTTAQQTQGKEDK